MMKRIAHFLTRNGGSIGTTFTPECGLTLTAHPMGHGSPSTQQFTCDGVTSVGLKSQSLPTQSTDGDGSTGMSTGDDGGELLELSEASCGLGRPSEFRI